MFKVLTTGYSSNTQSSCQDSVVASGNAKQLQDLNTFPKILVGPNLKLSSTDEDVVNLSLFVFETWLEKLSWLMIG